MIINTGVKIIKTEAIKIKLSDYFICKGVMDN